MLLLTSCFGSETLRNLHQGGGDGKHLRISLKQEVSEPVPSSKVLNSVT